MWILALLIAGLMALGSAVTRLLDRLPKRPNDWTED